MCITPLTLKNKYTDEYCTVPCSKCPECRSRRASGWSFRLRQEEKICTSAYFLTITYDTLYVPITESKRLTLCKRDLQLFIKRVRKAHGWKFGDTQQPIKYYAVGEYGSRTWRPHYHVIIFNLDLSKMFNKIDMLKLKHSNYDGKLELQCKQWKHGHVTVGKVSAASVGYTLKYISKPKKVPQYKGDDRLSEFSLMSKHIGENYLTEAMCKWHIDDVINRVFCVIEDGKKISMPRYYKDKLYMIDERTMIRDYFFEKHTQKIIDDFNPQTYARQQHEMKEAIKAAYHFNILNNKTEIL